MRKPNVLAGGSIVIGLAVLSLKYFAFILTGSIAFYSDALESVVNVATAVVTLVAVNLAAYFIGLVTKREFGSEASLIVAWREHSKQT